MKRRAFVAAGTALLAGRAFAQQKRTVRIGVLSPRPKSVILGPVLGRLRELGYVEGRNLILEYRSAGGVADRFPALARELVAAKCDVIFAAGSIHPALALRDATSDVPIVIVAIDYDPVKAGIVQNLRRPGGNITGVYLSILELVSKRVEILHEVLPKATRFLTFADAYSVDQVEAMRQTAERRKMQLITHTFGSPPYAFAHAFERGEKAKVEALLLPTSPPYFDGRETIYELALKRRMPLGVGGSAWWAGTGWLLGYGVIVEKSYARAGDIAASILNGTSAGEIPVEQPSDFELAINLRTAKSLGLAIPQAVMVRASRIVE
jgi:putative ABC transport system substrate-binding protein